MQELRPTKTTYEQIVANTVESSFDARRLLAVGAIAVVGLGGLASGAEKAEATQSLRSVTELPGYKMNVDPGTRSQLEASTQLLEGRYASDESDTRYPWETVGTAVAIKFAGQNPNARYFLASNRAVGVGPETGSFKLPNNPLKSANYLNITGKKFAITDKNANSDMQQLTFAEADGVSVNTDGGDVSLVSVVSAGDYAQTGMRLSDVPSINWKGMAKAKPGQQMAVYGFPYGSNVAVKTVGRFLGTTQFHNEKTGITQTVDIVGIKPKTPNADACIAADGSIASAKNATTGPLTTVINRGYPGSPSGEVTPDAEALWRTTEQDLEVNLSKFTTLCVYGRINLKSMEAGLKNFAEQYGVQGL